MDLSGRTDAASGVHNCAGRTLGGSGAVNGAYFTRATRADFENWPSSWRYDDVLPYFKKSETDRDFEGEFHGTAGPIPVERRAWDQLHPLSGEFHAAALGAGFPDDVDKNAPDSFGVGRVPLNVSDHRRISTAIGYLMPALHRPNLRVESGVNVIRIAFSGTRAIGVDVLDDGNVRRIRADHVVVCSGAVATPHILLNSGVGPAEQLVEQGVSSFSIDRASDRTSSTTRKCCCRTIFPSPARFDRRLRCWRQPSTSLRSKSVRTPHLSQTWFPVRLAWTTASEWS